MIVAVLHGVNLDMLGRRDPAQYGATTLQALETQIYAWAHERGLDARCTQTNHEGTFVEQVHDAVRWAGAAILNPGAWTHYSYAIRDAVELFDVPVVEVHLSNVDQREEFRRHSVLADVVTHRVVGLGAAGYREALDWIRANQESSAGVR
jgi:3-dehydroquinate dehydratase-2